ncbi:lytic transglycosylase domain-containing protein [Amycolatopsis pigmentata]|uniref:Lytic transglycosylase domain-containing protein n=1 Tax=Amycolatopsis pigmentata TaxID=450801 RepID=A0ABW5FZ54_9PSEU
MRPLRHSRRRARIARRKIRRIGLRYKTFVALMGGLAAVVPAVAAGGGTGDWVHRFSTQHSRDAALVGGFDPTLVHVNVDGTLPLTSIPVDLPLPADEMPAAYILPGGLLGIPGTALKAYRNAADIMASEQPGCHIDWALIASIGRIESNHARGGYVDRNGKTLEPILGPELNGVGPVAAVPDTDHGVYDLDAVWDRAVGPTQFIPSTWLAYASDGNGDGVSDPNNIYDATLATARYLCSGGLDLSKPDQVRAAIYRYNNSDAYVAAVILWAEAYRAGVMPLPDSQVPIGAPQPAPALPAPAPVTPPPPPPTVTPPPPASSTTNPPSSTSGSTTPGTSTPGTSTPAPPGSSTPPPTCTSTTTSTSSPSPSGTPTSPTTPVLPPCAPPPPPPPPDGSSSAPATTSQTPPKNS